MYDLIIGLSLSALAFIVIIAIIVGMGKILEKVFG
jgi:hypothetical protein